MKRIILLGFLLCFIPSLSFSQIECSNKLLKEMVEQLPGNVQLNKGVGSEYMLPSLCKGKPVVVEYNDKGMINHVGVKFFNREVIAQHYTPIFHFIERYFLELLLVPSNEERKVKMRMDRVHITTDAFPMTNLKEGLLNIIASVSHDFSVYMTCNNNRYSASCMVNNQLLAKIDFPVRHELITGYTKLEAENSVYPSLMSYQVRPYASPDEVDMYAYKDSLYCSNEDFYVTEDIVSTSYYQKKEQGYVPLFSPDMLKESVYNLFNTDYDWKVEVEVTQHLYGGKKLSYVVPLAKLMDFLHEKGCMLYTGLRKYDKSTIEGVAMAVNMELGYQHMLSFSFDKNLLKEPSKHQIKVKMYSYIPMHNVSSLFGENIKRK